MSQDKRQFTASCKPETVETLDEFADRENLNRSQAVTRVTEEWAELTDEGRVPLELLEAEPQDAVPGENTPAADTVEAARANATTLVDTTGKSLAVGGALMLQWWVFKAPVLVSAPLLAAGVILSVVSMLALPAALVGMADGTVSLLRETLGGDEDDETASADAADSTEGAEA